MISTSPRAPHSTSLSIVSELLSIDFNELSTTWERLKDDVRVKEAISSVPVFKYEDWSRVFDEGAHGSSLDDRWGDKEESNSQKVTSNEEEKAADLGRGDASMSSKYFSEFLDKVDGNLTLFESQSVEDYVRSCNDVLFLHKSVKICDSILQSIEEGVIEFQTGLSDISGKIMKLQEESVGMGVKVANRIATHELLSTFIHQILVTPDLVAAIQKNPLDEHYIQHLDMVTKKLEHASQPGIKDLPSTQASLPALEKLRLCATHRIRDFLASKILLLGRPKTDTQSIQRKVLLKVKAFYQFLIDSHPQSAWDIRQLYVQCLSKMFATQFKSYLQSLGSLQKVESAGVHTELIGVKPGVSRGGSSSQKYLPVSVFRGSRSSSTSAASHGNVFSLSGREAILKELEAAPLIAGSGSLIPSNTHGENQKLSYYEQLFRSHQKLLIDTATSEYIFLAEFFVSAGVEQFQSLFFEVFGKAINLVMEHNELQISGSFDSVGILLMLKINKYNRGIMERRRLSIFKVYFDRLQESLLSRLKSVLDSNVASIRNTHTRQLASELAADAGRTHPHYISRRYAELASSLAALSLSLNDLEIEETITLYLGSMQASMDEFLQVLASELEDDEQSVIFKINNYSLILTVFTERCPGKQHVYRFEKLLQEHVDIYIEQQLNYHFKDLAGFVRASEAAISELKSNTSQRELIHSGKIDVALMEELVLKFSKEWNKRFKEMYSKTLARFTNFTYGMDILKQALTQVILYYSRFQQVISKCYPRQPQPAWMKELVPNNVLLAEIREYSRSI